TLDRAFPRQVREAFDVSLCAVSTSRLRSNYDIMDEQAIRRGGELQQEFVQWRNLIEEPGMRKAIAGDPSVADKYQAAFGKEFELFREDFAAFHPSTVNCSATRLD